MRCSIPIGKRGPVKGRGEEAPPGVRFSDISVLYDYASIPVTEGAPKYWLELRATREVTDAAWSGLASGIWYVVHPRAITGGCVGRALCLSGALNFIRTNHHIRRG